MQIPVSLLDQRLVVDGSLDELSRLGIEVHVRSIFLQGLLFVAPEMLPQKLVHAATRLAQIRTAIHAASTTPLAAALAFVLQQSNIDVAVVGVTSANQLREIISAAAAPAPGLDSGGVGRRRSHRAQSRALVGAPRSLSFSGSIMILAILQARMSSTRLPGKVLRPLAGRPMMVRQLDRLKRSQRIDRLVVATSTEPIDDAIADFCTREAILCHRGPLTDVLARFAGAAEAFGPADHIVRLTADCPLTDWEIIDACINLHLETGSDYTSNGVERTFPDGLDVEVMTAAAALKRTQAQAAAGPEREHVTMYIYRNPSQFRLTHLKQSFDLSFSHCDGLSIIRQTLHLRRPCTRNCCRINQTSYRPIS